MHMPMDGRSFVLERGGNGRHNLDHELHPLTKERMIFHRFYDGCPMYGIKYGMLAPNDAYNMVIVMQKKNFVNIFISIASINLSVVNIPAVSTVLHQPV